MRPRLGVGSPRITATKRGALPAHTVGMLHSPAVPPRNRCHPREKLILISPPVCVRDVEGRPTGSRVN